jgi:hypothetical protein
MADQVKVRHAETGTVETIPLETWDGVYSQDVDRYGWELVPDSEGGGVVDPVPPIGHATFPDSIIDPDASRRRRTGGDG